MKGLSHNYDSLHIHKDVYCCMSPVFTSTILFNLHLRGAVFWMKEQRISPGVVVG